MLGFFFGKKGKFKLQPKMKVELEIINPDGAKSYFATIKEATNKRVVITTPKEGNKYIQLEINEVVRCITLIGDTVYEVNLKVAHNRDHEFESIISANIKHFDTILTNLKDVSQLEIKQEVPLDFRAMRTSHLQGATTKNITKDSVEMVTNLPVPEGTDLRLVFKVPESPIVEAEGQSEKSIPLEEDSKKSKTRIIFSEKAKENNLMEQITQYVIHYQRRLERRREMEEKGEIPRKDDEIKPPPSPSRGPVRKP
jgi:hypothetical protein